MPRQSTVYEVLIASPSDVVKERGVIAEVLEDWNSANSRSQNVSLQALRWELDAVPSTGEPQQIINKHLVEKADILVAVFWTRLGTPTGVAPSGTAEEIEYFRSQGKPVLLYFSKLTFPTITIQSNSDFCNSIENIAKRIPSIIPFAIQRNYEDEQREIFPMS